MCRMNGASMRVLRPGRCPQPSSRVSQAKTRTPGDPPRLSMRRHLDVAAAVAAARDHEGEPRAGRPAPLRLRAQPLRLARRSDDGEAGRSPGALPDAADALRLQPA